MFGNAGGKKEKEIWVNPYISQINSSLRIKRYIIGQNDWIFAICATYKWNCKSNLIFKYVYIYMTFSVKIING